LSKDHKALLARQALKDAKGHKEAKVQLALQVRKAVKERLVTKGISVLKEIKDFRVTKVLLDHKAHRAPKDLLVLKVFKESKVLQALQVP